MALMLTDSHAQPAQEWTDPDYVRSETPAVRLGNRVLSIRLGWLAVGSASGAHSLQPRPRRYSVYKQGAGTVSHVIAVPETDPRARVATEGDIKGSRPGMLDILGRAKWSVSAVFPLPLLR